METSIIVEQVAQENRLAQVPAECLTGTKFEDLFRETVDALN